MQDRRRKKVAKLYTYGKPARELKYTWVQVKFACRSAIVHPRTNPRTFLPRTFQFTDGLTYSAGLNVVEEILLEPCVAANVPWVVCTWAGGMLYSLMDFPCSAGFQSSLASDIVEIKRRQIDWHCKKILASFPNTFQGYPKVEFRFSTQLVNDRSHMVFLNQTPTSE